MSLALGLAQRAARDGEVPVGAVLVLEGRVIGFGWNQKEVLFDPSAHAEVLALRMAGKCLKNWRMAGSRLFVTNEPCIMSAGAILASRVSKVIYGTPDKDAGAMGSLFCLHDQPFLGHKLMAKCLREPKAKDLLESFFRLQGKRKKP
jgi:tRNA(adenine34) deaminase